MAIQPVNRVRTLTVNLNSSSGSNIIPIYQNTGISVGSEFIPDYKIVSFNTFLKNLKAYASIKSLPEAPLPEFNLEDSETTKLYKTLDIEWNSPRKQLNLYIKSGNQNWSPIGSISMLNPMGYPYRIYNLMDLFTDNLALELGANSAIGVQVEDMGYGLLSGEDTVTIHGSYVEELYLVSKEAPINITVTGGGGSPVTPPPDYSIGNSSFISNEFILAN